MNHHCGAYLPLVQRLDVGAVDVGVINVIAEELWLGGRHHLVRRQLILGHQRVDLSGGLEGLGPRLGALDVLQQQLTVHLVQCAMQGYRLAALDVRIVLEGFGEAKGLSLSAVV